jgi:hypothetical protein
MEELMVGILNKFMLLGSWKEKASVVSVVDDGRQGWPAKDGGGGKELAFSTKCQKEEKKVKIKIIKIKEL